MPIMWKCIMVREERKKLDTLEMELSTARKEGFVSNHAIETNKTYSKRKPLVVIGIFTNFGSKNSRDAIRRAWMGTGKYTNFYLIFSYNGRRKNVILDYTVFLDYLKKRLDSSGSQSVHDPN